MRQTSGAASGAMPVARVALRHLDGQPACVEDVSGGQLQTDRFADVAIRCRLTRDGPATLAIYSLGREDIAISAVHLRWND
jgi:hypothetical protein